MSSEETYKTVAQLAAKLQLSRKTVYRRCHQPVNPWPFHRAGEHSNSPIRFSPQDEAAIEQLLRPKTAPVVAAITPAQLRKVGKTLLKKPRGQGLVAA